MNFLERLQASINQRQAGIPLEKIRVNRKDVKELLYHFDRLDQEARERYRQTEGVQMIGAERSRQIEQEGWTPDHDRGHTDGELAIAAMVYACPPEYRDEEFVNDVWPFDMKYFKSCPEDRERELVKAGAFIAAELDRLRALGGGK